MSYDYSENVLIQESAANLLRDELGWEEVYAYNTEQLGEAGTLGRKSYKEILLTRYFREALPRLNSWLTPAQLDEAHRSQYGIFAENMVRLLPTASRIGFTGTPLSRPTWMWTSRRHRSWSASCNGCRRPKSRPSRNGDWIFRATGRKWKSGNWTRNSRTPPILSV